MSKSQPKKGFNERYVTLPFPQPMMSTNGSVVYPFKEKGFPLFFGSINFNEKCVEITDEMSVNSLKNMGFFGFHSKFRYISNKDLKKTFLKHNRSEDSEQNSCDSKTKNQIPLDSKYSNGKYVLTSISIPNALEFSDVQSCDETPKSEEIEKSDTVVSQSSGQIGLNLTVELETEKVLKLSFLESFFLSYIFGSLNVLNTKTNDYMTIEQMWTLFGSVYSEDSLEFAVHYSAYHYFRSKGWVVRNGYTFGTHFLLYKEGPHLYHSSYSVLIQYSIDGQYKQSFDWYYMSALIRLSKNVRKELIVCVVNIPKNCDNFSPKSIQNFEIGLLRFDRWNLNKTDVNPQQSC